MVKGSAGSGSRETLPFAGGPGSSFFREPVMHAGEHGGEREIGIGVGARRAMFDAARLG